MAGGGARTASASTSRTTPWRRGSHSRPRPAARDLRVDLELQNGFDVSTDRELLGLILRNLYENAVAYCDRGGRVRIATGPVGRTGLDLVSVEVSNSGSRLSADELPEATRRFWRGDAARTAAGLHCGLGLSLVEKAAEALGGRLELRSAEGADFVARVTFPGRSRPLEGVEDASAGAP